MILFLGGSAVFEVLTTIGSVGRSSSPVNAQLGGPIGSFPMVVGRESQVTLSLYLASGTQMSPACVGGNLSPEFKVTQVTFLGSPGSAWTHNESCGGILETNSTVPVVISLVPLHAGDFSIHVAPKVRRKTVGSARNGEIRVNS